MGLKIKRLFLLSFVLILFTLVPVSAQPGSEEDPLVSKKYVDDKINTLEDMITRNAQASGQDGGSVNVPPAAFEISPELRAELLAEALAGVESAYGEMIRQAAGNAPGGNPGYPAQVPPTAVPLFEVVFAESGAVIFFDASTEVILRGGSAVVISGTDGICDVTSGTDIASGQHVPYNHLLIVPVGDGRGVQVNNDASFMIKGGYHFG